MGERINRRDFLKFVAASAAGLTAASAVGLSCTELEQNARKLDGQPIPGEGIKTYMTDTFGNGEAIILRPEANTGSDVEVDGKTVYGKAGFLVDAQPTYGVVYESWEYEEGKFARINGNWYGRWYKIEKIPIFKKNDLGQLIPVGVANGVFVSGNFLTRASDRLDNQSSAGQ